MNGFKVRLGDGSEIGPMDLAALKTWISQGLVDRDSPVMRPGSRKWAPLGSIPEFKGSAGPRRRAAPASAGAGRTRGGGREAAGAHPAADPQDRWRMVAAGVLLIVFGVLLASAAFSPSQVLPALEAVPWLQLALGFLALGLALLPGWPLSRRIVRALVCLAAFALFPAAGILFAQGERGAALAAAGSAWLVLSGLLALLAPSLPVARAVLALLVSLAGLAGAVHFAHAPATEEARQLREWSAPERRFTDDALGLTLQIPSGWVALKAGNPIVAASADARVTLVQPRRGGRAWLATGPAPLGVATAEQYLDSVVARRRSERPGYTVGPHADTLVGTLPGRRATATWSDGGVRQSELVVAGLDGWMGFALVAWIPDDGAGRAAGDLEPLAASLVARGLFAARLREAVSRALAAVPHLTSSSATQLMAASEARVLEPEQAFRRSVAALAKLVPELSQPESRELAGLSAAVYAGLPWAERSRLSSYIERVRKGDTTPADEDREMARLMKAAESRLAPARLTRLRAYYDKAVQAGS